MMRTRSLLLLSSLAFCGGAFGALTNHAEHVDQDWSTDMVVTMVKTDGSATNAVGFLAQTAGAATEPGVTNGVFELTMVGATNGTTQIITSGLNSYKFANALSYIVTTRLKVTQYPDSNPVVDGDTGNARGITIMDIRGIQRAIVCLEPDSVWVVDNSAKWRKAADITTAEGTYYTWQVEVDQLAGTLDIFRRDNDADPWVTVATNMAIRNQNVVDQLILFPTRFNEDNTQLQAILESDYLQIGDGDFTPPEAEVPAPPASYVPWIDKNWNSDLNIYLPIATNSAVTNFSGFYTAKGGAAPDPILYSGKLRFSMEGATNGFTQIQSTGLSTREFSVATNYNMTTRMKVVQFPDTTPMVEGGSSIGINLCDIRGINRLYVHLEPDSIWVLTDTVGWKKAADVATEEGTYYTWQLEVHQGTAGTAGTVDLFRRESDLDAWTTVATNAPIHGLDISPDQWLIYPIRYNAENAQVQGVVVSDYLQFGYPFSGSMYNQWAESFGLTGSDALQTADVEPDGVDNLTEYALGGDPTVDDAAAILPTSGTISEGGTDWLEYVYNRRKDYAVLNLEYNVETVNDLVYGAWTNDNYTVSGIGSIDADFEAVTNRVDTGAEKEAFIRLLIQEN